VGVPYNPLLASSCGLTSHVSSERGVGGIPLRHSKREWEGRSCRENCSLVGDYWDDSYVSSLPAESISYSVYKSQHSPSNRYESDSVRVNESDFCTRDTDVPSRVRWPIDMWGIYRMGEDVYFHLLMCQAFCKPRFVRV
jgi:hypothetical protein